MNEPLIFLVRVWRGEPRFRASARDAREEDLQWFDSPEQMAAYLFGRARGDAPPTGAGPTNGGPDHGDPRR